MVIGSDSVNLSSPSTGGVPVQSAIKSHRKLARASTSVAPPNGGALPSANVRDWLNKHHNEMVVHGSRSQQQPLQTAQEHPHAPLSPQSSESSSVSGSDSHHDDSNHGGAGLAQARNTFLEDKSGMRGAYLCQDKIKVIMFPQHDAGQPGDIRGVFINTPQVSTSFPSDP